ncbi:MAG: RHS repeat-associated core domain-containing protein, partial [Eubacterium sp.]|nr:RHS repeat-associated core domain-containing protein [Eubacterium sp.]
MTNQLGDVISITDAQGKELVEYEYDEWGSMLDITLKSDDEIVSTLAELNPLRYRGYYYDNETGMYYLQSRYYNPEWGRFISADSFNNIGTSIIIDLNTYIYGNNSPIMASDPQGTKSNIPLGHQDWTYRREYNQENSRGNEHIHVDSKQNGKHYAQNDDGSPHDEGNNSSGSPPGKVKKKLKEKTGWDWDAKAKQYENEQKENSEKFSLDFCNAADVLIFTIFLVFGLVSGVGIIFI